MTKAALLAFVRDIAGMIVTDDVVQEKRDAARRLLAGEPVPVHACAVCEARREAQARGGRTRSRKKIRAAKANGKLGGRPEGVIEVTPRARRNAARLTQFLAARVGGPVQMIEPKRTPKKGG